MADKTVHKLDLFVKSVKLQRGRLRAPVLACRLLDYPTFFVRPKRGNTDSKASRTVAMLSGKSCMFAEAPSRLQSLLQQVCAAVVPPPCSCIALAVAIRQPCHGNCTMRPAADVGRPGTRRGRIAGVYCKRPCHTILSQSAAFLAGSPLRHASRRGHCK